MIGDEAMSTNELIEMIKSSKGNEKKQLLLKLCEHNDDIADSYFSDKIGKKNMLPYLCHCRCHSISDYSAQLLDDLIDKLIFLRKRGNLTNDEMYTTFDEMFYVLNMIMFKQSDKLFKVFEKVGEYYEILKSYMMSYHDISFSRSLPSWLRKRAGKCKGYCCESNFIRAVNHVLIRTMLCCDDVSDKIRYLSEKYPKAFGLAGVCEMFIHDSTEAYIKYGNDEYGDDILTIFKQIEYVSAENKYTFNSEMWFCSSENKEYTKATTIYGGIDIRWIEYITSRMPKEIIIRHFSKKSMFSVISSGLAYRRLDRMLLPIVNSDDEVMLKVFRDYFIHNAVLYTNAEEFYGLELCGGYDPEEVIMKITENICQGVNDCRAYYTAFSVFEMNKRTKLKLLDKAAEYLNRHYSELNTQNQRLYTELLREIKAFRENKNCVFKHKYYTV